MIYTIENEILLAKISTLGATLVSLIDKKSGIDVVLGYDDEKSYLLNSDAHLGATVGRNANRIAKGHFKINGIDYQLSINNGPNNLHSGISDFSFRTFEIRSIKEDEITLNIKDSDMTGGFPGNLILSVNYRLEGNSLIFSFLGLCDKDSILNVTNHSYFNLNGAKENIYNHFLQINTDKMSLNDNDGMTTDKVIDVKGTGFDFTKLTNIKENFDKNEENFSNGGIDHNYIFGDLKDKEVAILKNDKLSLTVTSDLPCVHVYTSNFVDELDGKDNLKYHKHWGICIECDYYPNGINYKDVLVPIIKANEEVKHYIKYTIA